MVICKVNNHSLYGLCFVVPGESLSYCNIIKLHYLLFSSQSAKIGRYSSGVEHLTAELLGLLFFTFIICFM